MSDVNKITPHPENTEPQLPAIADFEWLIAVRDVLSEHGPEYVYQTPGNTNTCLYFDDRGCPSCLFGRVLAKFNVTLDRLGLEEGADVTQVMHALDIHDEALVYACNNAQGDQDGGRRYGDVLVAFNAAYAAFSAGRDSV